MVSQLVTPNQYFENKKQKDILIFPLNFLCLKPAEKLYTDKMSHIKNDL